MPSADFCPAVRPPLGCLSPRSDTEQISWGNLSRLPCTVAESTLRTLMDMDFAVRCPLVRRSRLLFDFCPSTRTFAWCFLQTPPRGDGPCTITSPSPPSGWAEDFHLRAAEHAQHTTKALRASLRRAGGSGEHLSAGACRISRCREASRLEDRGVNTLTSRPGASHEPRAHKPASSPHD